MFGRAHEFGALDTEGPGTEFYPDLHVEPGDLVFVKPRVSAFYVTRLEAALRAMAFRRYLVGFGARCVCIALALTVGGHSMFVAGERILNVILGGAIGLACVLVLRWFSGITAARD